MPPTPFWARSRFVVVAILVYLVTHFVIRMMLGPALSVDDSEQALFAQRYALSYGYRSPPLLTWVLVTVGNVMPISLVTITLVRYLFLGITYIFAYLTARRLIDDPRLSALAIYSFAAIHIFSESSHRNLSHSITLAAMLALSWYAFVRLAARPRLGWYALLGVLFGLGLLAKWNFAIFALALPLACLLHPDGRRLLLTWKTLAAIIPAVAIPAPAGIAMLQMSPPDGQDMLSALAAEGSGFDRALDGSLKLIETSLLYCMPFLPIVVVVFGIPIWRGIQVRWKSPENAFGNGAAAVGATIAIGLAALWILVLVAGATELKVRYMHPILLILPIWLFMVIESGRPARLATNILACVLAVLVLQVAAARALQPTGLVSCGLCPEWRPFGPLAQQIKAAGYRGAGTMVTDAETGGNMRIQFPDARVLDPFYPRTSLPSVSGMGQCLIVYWDDGDPRTREASLGRYESYLENTLQGRAEAAYLDGVVSAPMLAPAEGILRLGYRLYDAPNGDCR